MLPVLFVLAMLSQAAPAAPPVPQQQDARLLFGQGLQGRSIPATQSAAAGARAIRLGVRYNLLRTNPQTRQSVEVDPEYNFRKGDCVQARFVPNRSGLLFVLNQTSAGGWKVLFPALEVIGEENVVRAGVETLFPAEHCLRVDDPPGVDVLTVIISDNDDDVKLLNAAIRNPAGAMLAQAMARLEPQAVAVRSFASRDLTMVRMSDASSPQGDSESPPYSVYVVKSAAQSNDSLVLNIRIRHEK